MSNNVTLGSANIVITATNRIGAGLDSAATQLSAFTKVVAQNWWGVKNLGLAFAALPAAVTAGVALSVRAAAEWESSMVDVQRTTTGFTAAGTEAFKTIEAGLKDLASSTPIPIKDLAQIASAAGALGVRSEDVLKFTKTVVNLSQTTDLSAQQASVALARIAALTGLTADQYDNLASSILKTGQETAATEQEIVAIATRLAGAAGVIGLTSDEVIGISAALASAGVKSEAAGTAMIQTFLRMQQAVLDNGAALDKWAAIAGQSAGDFATAFQNDPGQAIAMVVKGLGTLNGGMATAAIRLNDVGITGRREKQALLGLAVAESQTGNESLKLSNILVKSREGMLDSELAADLAARKFHTFSGQVATLHNQIQILSIGFGKHVLPVLEPMVSLFQNFINVITMLPGPVKAAFGVVLGLLTVFTGLGALILLIGPRFLILIDGANKIFKAFTAAATGVNLQTQALQANTVAANQNAAAQNAAAAAASGAGGTGAAAGGAAGATKTVQPRLPNGRLGKGVQVPVGAQVPAGATADDLEKLAAGEAAVGEEAVVAGTAVAGFGTKVLGIVSSIGALVVVLGAVTGLINLFGNKTKLQAKAAEDAAKANHELVGILSDQKKATEGAADAWIMHQSAMQGAIGVGAKLGLSTDNLLKIIKGTANDAERKDFFAKVADGAKRGVPQVDLFKDAMARLNLTFQTSAKDANSVIRGNGKIIGTQEEVSAFMEQEEENTKKAIQARLDYIEAGRSLHDANISVRDALESYKDALSEAKLKADRLTEAEDKLAQAHRAEQEAARAVKKAQENLDHARQDGIDELASAEDSLAEARDRHLDLLDKIADQEKKVAELRAGPEVDDLRDATNKLAAAQLNLKKSTQSVADAEWKLQYLREQGASNRDIQDAETNVAEAKLNVADATDAQIDAQKDLDRLTDPVQQAKDLAEAERELASMRRDDASTLRDILKDEQNVDDLRQRVATDDFYRQAQDDLADAQERVHDATLNTMEAEQALAKSREGTDNANKLADAQDRVTDALYAQAKAKVALQKDKFVGETGQEFTPDMEAEAMAKALGEVAKQAPTDAVKKQLLELAGAYGDVKKKADKAADAASKMQQVILTPEVKLSPKWVIDWTPLKKQVLDAFGGGTGVGAVAGGTTGGIIGGIIGALGGPIGIAGGIIIGAAIGALAGYISSHWDGIGGAIRDAWDSVWSWIRDYDFDGFWGDVWRGIETAFKSIFDSNSPSKKMMELGTDAVQGFLDGLFSLGEKLAGWGSDTFDKVTSGLTTAGTWLWNAGLDVGRGFVQGAWSILGDLGNFGKSVSITVMNAFSDIGSWLKDSGKDLVHGLIDGIQWAWKNLFVPVWNAVVDAIPGTFADRMKIGSPSKVFKGYGENIISGLTIGLSDVGSLQRSMGTLSDAMAVRPNQYALDALRPTSGSGSMTSAAMGGQAVTNYNFNLETHTGASASELMNEFAWSARTRLR